MTTTDEPQTETETETDAAYVVAVDGNQLRAAGAAIRDRMTSMSTELAELIEQVAPQVDGWQGKTAETWLQLWGRGTGALGTTLGKLGVLGDLLTDYATEAEQDDARLANLFRTGKLAPRGEGPANSAESGTTSDDVNAGAALG